MVTEENHTTLNALTAAVAPEDYFFETVAAKGASTGMSAGIGNKEKGATSGTPIPTLKDGASA